MKKKYLTPSMYEIESECAQILCNSGVKGSNGIGYGGVDDGTHDPSSRYYQYDWDEDDEM